MSLRRPKGHPVFATLYDRLTRPLERSLIQPLRQGFSRLEGSILEIGVGTGVNLPYYAVNASVVAIEPDPYMLARAAERLGQFRRTEITLCQAQAEALPFREGSFAHVVSTLVLCTVLDPGMALAEIRRLLKPDGHFHFVEHVRADGWIGRGQDFVQPLYSYFMGGCQPNRRTLVSIEAAGFRIEDLQHRTVQFGTPLLIGRATPG